MDLDNRASHHGSVASSFGDQEIDPREIQVCIREDGSHWKLGEGGFGCVSFFVYRTDQAYVQSIVATNHQEQDHPSTSCPSPQ